MSGELRRGGRLGLGQVVGLGVVRELHLDEVEQREVGLVTDRPSNAQANERPGREIDRGGVLFGAREDEQGELGAAVEVGAVGGRRSKNRRGPPARTPTVWWL